MKLIHCADIHLDSKMESNLDKEQASARRDELLDTFERMFVFAKEEGVRAILISGDMFDKPHIRREVKRRVLEQINANPQIDIFYIKGNHDRCDFLEEGIDEVPKNFHLFTDVWKSYECEDIVITGMELTKENGATMGNALVLDSAKCNIVMLHGQKSDYDGKDKAEIINLNSLKKKNIDYLALGHIHKFEQEPLDDRGIYCYSGCLEGRGFDETGDKGFVLLDAAGGKISSEFIPFAYRRLHELEVKVDETMDMMKIIKKCTEACDDVDPQDFVKFVVTGQRDLDDDVDTERIIRSFQGKYYFVKCYDKTKRVINYDDYLYDKSLKGEFVRLMKDKKMDEDKKARIIETGIRAIMGEDI